MMSLNRDFCWAGHCSGELSLFYRRRKSNNHSTFIIRLMRKDLYLSTKGHGYIKKTKAYGAVGAIALTGVISIAGNTSVVLAEESDIPSSDPVASNDSNASDVIQAEVISSDLNQSIDEANTEGVILTEQDPVTYQSLEEAQTDLEQQTVEVQKAVEEKKNNNDNVEEIEAKNAEIKKRNEEGQAAVDKYNQEGQAAVDARNAAGQAEVDQRNKEGQEAVDKRNAEGQAAVDARNAAGQAEVDARNAAGQAAVDQRNAEGQAAVDEENACRKAEYDAKMEAYNQALADLEEKMRQYNEGLATYEEVGEALAQLEETGATTFGLQPSGAWTNLKPVEVVDGVKVYSLKASSGVTSCQSMSTIQQEVLFLLTKFRLNTKICMDYIMIYTTLMKQALQLHVL